MFSGIFSQGFTSGEPKLNAKGLRHAPALRGKITLLELLALCLGSSPLRGQVELPLEEEVEEEVEEDEEEEDTRETSDAPSFATKIAAVAVGRPKNPTRQASHITSGSSEGPAGPPKRRLEEARLLRIR